MEREHGPRDCDPRGRLRIGQLAGECGLNPKTIRFYEQLGLLPSPRRTGNGYRLYSEADRERLRFIGQAKAIGLSLAEIGEILALGRDGTRPCGHVQALLDQKIAAIDRQIAALADMRRELAGLRAAARGGPEGRVCGIIEGFGADAEAAQATAPPGAECDRGLGTPSHPTRAEQGPNHVTTHRNGHGWPAGRAAAPRVGCEGCAPGPCER